MPQKNEPKPTPTVPLGGWPKGHKYNTYEVTVTFLREFSDDMEIIEAKGECADLPWKEAVAKQLQEELQEAYDKVGLSGLFMIDVRSIQMGSSHYDRLRNGYQAAVSDILFVLCTDLGADRAAVAGWPDEKRKDFIRRGGRP